MKNFIWALFFITMLLACNSKKNLPKPFTKEMLTTQVFSIKTDKDTSLETVHGSLIRIKAGSFNVTGYVQVEIKEALTSAEMLAAGLVTESNGIPLRSAGMIYINAKSNDKSVELIKPIKISIPNQYYDSSMQVFKGVGTDSSGINWIDPEPVDTNVQSLNWQVGKAIFQSKCASCHNIFRPIIGPALMELENRGPWTDRKNIYSFIHNPSSFMATNKYTQNLKSIYGSMMTGFPMLSNDDIDAILYYIKNEPFRPGTIAEEKFNDSLSKDLGSFKGNSCKDDTVYSPIPKQNQSFFANQPENIQTSVIADTMPKTTDTMPKTGSTKAEQLEGLRQGFDDPNSTSGMYDFEIKTFGWYNVDAYVEGYGGSSNVKVWVQLQVDFDISMHVYLFCPRNKMLSVMNDKRDEKFFFNKINEGIPLFLNDKAILFAFSSKNDKIYYGISEFRVQGEQTIHVKVRETSEEEIRKALYAKELEGIDLGIEKKEKKIIKKNCDELQIPAKDTIGVK